MDDPLSAGLEALRAGDFAGAAPLLAAAAAANPGDYRARMALGAALGELQRWSEAIAALQEAAALAPGVPATHHNLGNALEKAGRIEEARREYQFTLQVDPTHQRAGAALRRLMDAAAAAVLPAPAAAPPLVTSPPATAAAPSLTPPPAPAAPSPAPSASPRPAPVPLGDPEWPALHAAAAANEGQAWPVLADGSTPAAMAAPPPAAPPTAPPAAAAAPPPAAVTLPAETDEDAVPEADLSEEAARARARVLRERIAREAPPKPDVPPLREQIAARLRPLVRPLVIGLIILAAGAAGYAVYYEALGAGKVHRDALKEANRSIREGYAAIQRGMETGDAALLAPYAPKRMAAAPTEAEIKTKSAQLRKMEIRCSIDVLRIDLEKPKGDEASLSPTQADATIAVRLKGVGIAPIVNQGEQLWQRVGDRWLPDPDPANWHIFGSTPIMMGK